MRGPANVARRLLGVLAVLLAGRAGAADDVALRAMKDELARSTGQLRLERMERPYFVSYRMVDVDGVAASAELGSLTSVQPERSRAVMVELRVGDPACDNSNYVSTGRWGGSGLTDLAWVTLDDDYQQIRRQLWLTTDALYKRALEDLSAKRAALKARARTDELPDFSREAPLTATEARAGPCPPRAEIEALVRELSAVFRSTPEIHGSSVKLECRDAYVRYASSEGTSFTRAAPAVKLEIQAETRAASALPISDSIELFGRTPADLPTRKALLERERALVSRIPALRTSPSLERYNGPVLFEGLAAAELFAQQFAGGLVTLRQPVSDDPRFEVGFERLLGQMGGGSFAEKLGGRVLPLFLSVTNDPVRQTFRGAPLLGGYRVDDEGVASRVTRLVDHGVLKTLLATRTPARGVPRSTGSRRGWAAAPANVLVTSQKVASGARLRRELLQRARSRGLEFAIVVRHLGRGGASPLARLAARAAAEGGAGYGTSIAEVYRVFLDGREELLQGMELSDVTPGAFKDIVAVGDSPAVHSLEFLGGIGSAFFAGPAAGASGLPVVSYVVPALLFDELTLVRSRGPFPELPVTPSPLSQR